MCPSITVGDQYMPLFNDASTVEDQVNLVRSINSDASILDDRKRRLFVAMYLVVPLKHAVRGTIVK